MPHVAQQTKPGTHPLHVACSVKIHSKPTRYRYSCAAAAAAAAAVWQKCCYNAGHRNLSATKPCRRWLQHRSSTLDVEPPQLPLKCSQTATRTRAASQLPWLQLAVTSRAAACCCCCCHCQPPLMLCGCCPPCQCQWEHPSLTAGCRPADPLGSHTGDRCSCVQARRIYTAHTQTHTATHRCPQFKDASRRVKACRPNASRGQAVKAVSAQVPTVNSHMASLHMHINCTHTCMWNEWPQRVKILGLSASSTGGWRQTVVTSAVRSMQPYQLARSGHHAALRGRQAASLLLGIPCCPDKQAQHTLAACTRRARAAAARPPCVLT